MSARVSPMSGLDFSCCSTVSWPAIARHCVDFSASGSSAASEAPRAVTDAAAVPGGAAGSPPTALVKAVACEGRCESGDFCFIGRLVTSRRGLGAA